MSVIPIRHCSAKEKKLEGIPLVTDAIRCETFLALMLIQMYKQYL